jgi:hypothetical protein
VTDNPTIPVRPILIMTDTAAIEVQGSYWELHYHGVDHSQVMSASVFRPADENWYSSEYRMIASFNGVTLIAFADEIKALADVDDDGPPEGEGRILHP